MQWCRRSLAALGISPAGSRFAHARKAAQVRFLVALPTQLARSNCDIIGSLAHLGLGRAYVVAGDTKKARTEYYSFLTLWKDADPDIPTLKQAKAEYAKLK